MSKLKIIQHENGIVLVDTEAQIPSYANFLDENGKIHKNRWRNSTALKRDFYWYYMIIAASFPIDGLPRLDVQRSVDMVLRAGNKFSLRLLFEKKIIGYEIQWWLYDSTMKSEMMIELKKTDTIDGVLPRPELNALYGERLYRKLILKYEI